MAEEIVKAILRAKRLDQPLRCLRNNSDGAQPPKPRPFRTRDIRRFAAFTFVARFLPVT